MKSVNDKTTIQKKFVRFNFCLQEILLRVKMNWIKIEFQFWIWEEKNKKIFKWHEYVLLVTIGTICIILLARYFGESIFYETYTERMMDKFILITDICIEQKQIFQCFLALYFKQVFSLRHKILFKATDFQVYRINWVIFFHSFSFMSFFLRSKPRRLIPQ